MESDREIKRKIETEKTAEGKEIRCIAERGKTEI